MTDRRRAALVGAGVAGAAVAGGMVGRTLLRRRRDQHSVGPLAELPPQDLGTVRSFDGTELAVRAAGDPSSPVLLFVHGFSLDMTTWHGQWTGLSGRFRCVLFDQRSHGRSPAPESGDLSLAALGHDLAAVLDASSPDAPVVLVGHSMGGMSILAMAEAHPELFGSRVAGTVFVGTAASDVLRGAFGQVGELLRPRLGTMSQAAARVNRLRKAVLAGGADVGHVIARLTQFGPDAPPQLVNYVVGLAARAPSGVWTDGLAGLMELDLRHAVRHVTCPSLVIVGELDRVTPPSLAVALAGELPEGRLDIVERAGHMAMLEQPAAVNELLAAFADEVLVPAKPARGKRAK